MILRMVIHGLSHQRLCAGKWEKQTKKEALKDFQEFYHATDSLAGQEGLIRKQGFKEHQTKFSLSSVE